MPFGIHKHSNRSKQALNDPAVGTATPSSGGSASPPIFASGTDEARTVQAFIQQTSQARAESEPYASQSPVPDIDRRTYQYSGDLPARSQSTRYPSAYQHQAQHLQAGSSADDLALDSRKLQQIGTTNSVQATVIEPKKSKSIFDRMRSGSSRASEQKLSTPAQSSYNNTAGLARRLSKRQDNSPVIRTAQQRTSLEQQQRLDWQAGQDSRLHLPSPQEGSEDDSGLDPYLIRESEQEDHHISPQEQSQQQTIRPVPSDSEAPIYSTEDDGRQHFQVQQQYSLNQAHQQSELAYQSHLQSSNLSQPHLQVNNLPGSLAANDQYRSQQNPETVSQLSYDSPIEQREEQQPISVQSNGQSPTGFPPQRQEYPNRTTSIQGPRPLSQHTMMAPPTPVTSQQNRRSADPKQTVQGVQGQQEPREGPPTYRQSPSFNQPSAPGLAAPAVGSSGPNYRGGPPQRDQYGATGSGEQGRSTPPPAPGDRDLNDAYKELLTKYKKVKGLYFDKTAQVEQLQNTLANQRLSQSRTSLDDSEYMTRFQRLDGATTNLAFNIRKDWRSVPSWLSQYVNQDAMKIGKQEMTAVGRACITRFLVDEVFNRSFHPGLEGDLSTNLKNIEQNMRRFSPALNNQEESDALTAKVVQWRLATLDGLKDVLSSPESEEFRKLFAQVATTNLAASLINFLQEPVPAGIEDSAHMIVELAVSIACNVPLESRDISIVYPMPGDLVQPFIMKIESGIPPLENPWAEALSEVDASSTGSGDKEETSKEGEKSDPKNRKEKTKSTGMLQAMMGGSSGSTGGKKVSVNSQGGADVNSEGKGKVSTEDGAQKVRFSGFVGVEVRGRQMLVKAPVWTVS